MLVPRQERSSACWQFKYPHQSKVPICIQGHKDPDLIDYDSGMPMRRDCPIISQLGLMLLLQVIASCQLSIWTSDAKTAFMQSGKLSRKNPLYLRQPVEQYPGCTSIHQLLLVLGCVYGLADAPRAWWKTLCEALEKLGFIQLTLDVAIIAA